MSAVLRTQTTGERHGFMKALVGRSDDRILGFDDWRGGRRGHRRGANGDAAGPAYPGFRDAISCAPR
jgi:hypothetical protein